MKFRNWGGGEKKKGGIGFKSEDERVSFAATFGVGRGKGRGRVVVPGCWSGKTSPKYWVREGKVRR